LEIYLLLFLLRGDGEGARWICLLHGGSLKDEGDNGVNNYLSMMI
jgi:hypothetical protein